MISVHAMYEKTSAAERFDMEYLVERRIPFVKEVLEPYGLRSIVVHKGIGSMPEGRGAKYCCVIVLSFETREGAAEAFRREGTRMNAGIREFTDIDPVVMVSEVVAT